MVRTVVTVRITPVGAVTVAADCTDAVHVAASVRVAPRLLYGRIFCGLRRGDCSSRRENSHSHCYNRFYYFALHKLYLRITAVLMCFISNTSDKRKIFHFFKK